MQEPLSQQDLTERIQIISQNIGLFNERDKEKSCYRIFIELLKAKKYNQVMNSQELADKSHLSRATVLHHITKLISSGIVKEHNHKFALMEPNLNFTILKLKKQILDMYDEMDKLSKEIDQELGI
jgi:biotin operon repressor